MRPCLRLGQIRFEEIWPAYARARPDVALLEGLFTPKLAELRRLVSDLVVDQERKVVVFSQWRRMLRLAAWSVSDLLADADLRAVFFTGAERPSQRTRNIVDFEDEPDLRIMFLSDAGGVGLNLQRAASACVNLELPWNPAVLEQRVGRIYRLGQRRPIDVHNLVSEGGIESRIAGPLSAKQALFSGFFHGTSAEIRFDTAASFLTRVERLLDPGVLPTPPGAPTGEPQAADSDDADEPAAAGAALADGAITDELQRPPELVEPKAAAGRHDGASDELLGVDPAGATRALLDALRIERTSDGHVRIEAPPEAASSLIALFEGMAKLLAASRPTR